MTIDPKYGCRKKTDNPKYDHQYPKTAKAFSASKHSVLALAPDSKIDDSGFTQFHRLTWYCRQKYISRSQGVGLIKKRWLAAIKQGGKIWVAERCPDEIQAYLEQLAAVL